MLCDAVVSGEVCRVAKGLPTHFALTGFYSCENLLMLKKAVICGKPFSTFLAFIVLPSMNQGVFP